jgi:hypothetical protein
MIYCYLFTFFNRFPEDSGVFSALMKTDSTPNPRLSSCSVIIQGRLSLITSSTCRSIVFVCFLLNEARDEEPLDPCFAQFPQSITLEEGGKAKFTCKLTGLTPMTGKNMFMSRVDIRQRLLLLAEWNINGKALDRQSSRFIFTDEETEFSFEIPVVLATDEGQYHVTISNEKGEITAAYSLHVDQS